MPHHEKKAQLIARLIAGRLTIYDAKACYDAKAWANIESIANAN
jgi:hypothetical protein